VEIHAIAVQFLAGLALAGAAPTTLAQFGQPGGGMRERMEARNNPQFQACKKQADDKNLPRGQQRKDFMQQCMKTAAKPSDAAKSEALREKMRDGQSGHLHSDPPASSPPAPASPTPPPKA
jgi:hypothetical protein